MGSRVVEGDWILGRPHCTRVALMQRRVIEAGRTGLQTRMNLQRAHFDGVISEVVTAE